MDALPKPARGNLSKSESSQPFQETPASHPLAAIERYYVSAEVASDALKFPNTKPTFTVEMQKPTSGSQSAGSSVGASASDSQTPFSTGLTPPTPMRSSKPQHERSLSQIPMSTSPEQYRHVHRSSSNLASAIAASIVRPFSFSTPDASSPPTIYSRKRMSPAASYLGTATSNSTWGHQGSRSRFNSNPQGSETRAPSSPYYEQQDVMGERELSFRIQLKNQDQFNNDGYAAEPLLDPAKQERYSAYRSMYASMLLTWELPITSCEILQYNRASHPKLIPSVKYNQSVPSSLILGENSPNIISRDMGELHLDFREHCSNCATIVPASLSGTRCSACSTKYTPVICQLCHSIVSGLSSPCLNCGHVLHLSCRSALQQDEATRMDGECIAGCGCHCADHIAVEIQTPENIDEGTPLVSATRLSANEQEELGWHDVSGETGLAADDSAPRDIAYESLVRNLGARFLTPKSSQVWRGGERRKASLGGFPDLKRSGSG
ncbi:MAG: hypothetical protein Q9186_003741 [Xanthomendoza sp. 1 TL-2023]